MFTTEQFQEMQGKVRQIEAEARKALSTLGDRAQAEMKDLLALAQVSSREQLGQLGKELVRLGQKLQDLAKEPEAAKTAEPDTAVN